MRFDYHYEDETVTVEQYGSKPDARVTAKFLPARQASLRGNPFWECLPVLPPYDAKNNYVPFAYEPTGPEGDDEERIEELDDIDDVRFPFGFQEEIQRKALRVLRRAAKDRMEMLFGNGSTIIVGDRKVNQCASFLPSTDGDVGNGFCLVGFPGSMKTTSMNSFLKKYPKVIDMKFDDGRKMLMVPFLYLTAPASGSLSALYDSGGTALDALMGNKEEHYCEKMVKREHTVGGKEAAFASLLISYNVLALVVDEVQELAASGKNKSSSFHSLVTMVNQTKCGLISIGTQDAIDKVYEEWYAGDRAGEPVDTSKVCLDKELIGDALRILFQWQWFDEKIDLADKAVFNDIRDVYVDCTGGSMRKIKALYKAANERYIKNRKTHDIVVNGSFFRDVATDRWPTLIPIMRIQQKRYNDLIKRLNRAKDPETKQQIEEAIEADNRLFSEIKAETESGDNSGVNNLMAAMNKHLQVEGKNVNQDDLEMICREVFTKNRDKCEDPVDLEKKVMTRLKSRRCLKNPKTIKPLYDVEPTDVKNAILNGNE